MPPKKHNSLLLSMVLICGVMGSPTRLYADDASAKAEIKVLNQRVVQLFGEGQYEAKITPPSGRSTSPQDIRG
jgi:hypothetical protein